MKLTGAEILARVENLSGSLSRTLEQLNRMETELQQIRSSLGGQSSEFQQLLSEDQGGQLGALSGGGVFLRQVSEIIEKLSVGNSQEEILQTLLEQSGAHLSRAIIFREENGVFRHWKSRGFDPALAKELSAEKPDDPVVRAAQRQCIIYREESPEEAFPWLRDAGDLPQASVCIPLVFGDQVPVVLYGDSTEPASLDTLELLSHLAVLVLKNQYLQSQIGEGPARQAAVPVAEAEIPAGAETESLAAQPVFEKTAAPTEPTPASAEPIEPIEPAQPIEPAELIETPLPPAEPVEAPDLQERAETALDEASIPAEAPPEPSEGALDEDLVNGELVEEDFLSEMSASEAAAQIRFEEPAKYDLPDQELGLHGQESAPSLESEAAGEPQPEESELAGLEAPVEEPPEPEPDEGPEPMLLPAEPEAAPPLDPEAERYHRQARRFARLLVTEIKLYNEETVEAGRREGDLYQRLKRDIDRSREMYEKRAHPSVKSHTDHFHQELERILARGNPELLGEGYPGPRQA